MLPFAPQRMRRHDLLDIHRKGPQLAALAPHRRQQRQRGQGPAQVAAEPPAAQRVPRPARLAPQDER